MLHPEAGACDIVKKQSKNSRAMPQPPIRRHQARSPRGPSPQPPKNSWLWAWASTGKTRDNSKCARAFYSFSYPLTSLRHAPCTCSRFLGNNKQFLSRHCCSWFLMHALYKLVTLLHAHTKLKLEPGLLQSRTQN